MWCRMGLYIVLKNTPLPPKKRENESEKRTGFKFTACQQFHCYYFKCFCMERYQRNKLKPHEKGILERVVVEVVELQLRLMYI